MHERKVGLCVLVLALGASGCAAEQQATAGGVVAGVGLGGALAGLGIAAGCEPHEDWDEPGVTQCPDGRKPDPDVGGPVAIVGLGVAIVGGAIIAATPARKPSVAPAPTTKPPAWQLPARAEPAVPPPVN
jgi:hypothetical protein